MIGRTLAVLSNVAYVAALSRSDQVNIPKEIGSTEVDYEKGSDALARNGVENISSGNNHNDADKQQHQEQQQLEPKQPIFLNPFEEEGNEFDFGSNCEYTPEFSPHFKPKKLRRKRRNLRHNPGWDGRFFRQQSKCLDASCVIS